MDSRKRPLGILLLKLMAKIKDLCSLMWYLGCMCTYISIYIYRHIDFSLTQLSYFKNFHQGKPIFKLIGVCGEETSFLVQMNFPENVIWFGKYDGSAWFLDKKWNEPLSFRISSAWNGVFLWLMPSDRRSYFGKRSPSAAGGKLKPASLTPRRLQLELAFRNDGSLFLPNNNYKANCSK